MEKNNNVIISSVRTEIKTDKEDSKYTIIYWFKDRVKALVLDEDSDNYMEFVYTAKYPKDKTYSIYQVDKYRVTINEEKAFVKSMINDSNFAKANKIKAILYRKEEDHPYAVVVEDF